MKGFGVIFNKQPNTKSQSVVHFESHKGQQHLVGLIDKCAQIMRDDRIWLRNRVKQGQEHLINILKKQNPKTTNMQNLQVLLRKYLTKFKQIRRTPLSRSKQNNKNDKQTSISKDFKQKFRQQYNHSIMQKQSNKNQQTTFNSKRKSLGVNLQKCYESIKRQSIDDIKLLDNKNNYFSVKNENNLTSRQFQNKPYYKVQQKHPKLSIFYQNNYKSTKQQSLFTKPQLLMQCRIFMERKRAEVSSYNSLIQSTNSKQQDKIDILLLTAQEVFQKTYKYLINSKDNCSKVFQSTFKKSATLTFITNSLPLTLSSPSILGQILQKYLPYKSNTIRDLFKFIDIQKKRWFDKNDIYIFLNEVIPNKYHQIYKLSQQIFTLADTQKRNKVKYWQLYSIKQSTQVKRFIELLQPYEIIIQN